jgi:hypothetical protein
MNALKFTQANPTDLSFNKDYQETSEEVSQIPNGTSDNPNIIGNFKNPLVSREQMKNDIPNR